MTEEQIRHEVYQEFVNAYRWERAHALDAALTTENVDALLEHKFYEGAVYALGDLACALWGVDTYVKWLDDMEHEYGI